MAYVQYTAQRSIKAGHSQGNSYSINFRWVTHQRQRRVISSENVSLGGQAETIVSRSENIFEIVTEILAASVVSDWREFIDSVEGGEGFVVDPDGTSGSPVSPVNCVMVKGSGSEVREADDTYRYRWLYRETG